MDTYIKRKLEKVILKYLKTLEIIAVVGPRQCGKTTLLKKIFQGVKKAEFISFEDIKTLNQFEEDIDGFIKLHVEGNKYLFIDEFQYSKTGGQKLKYIFDTQKTKIFISGSSSIDLTVNALKYLVGRIFIFNLYPLDFSEFLGFKDKRLQKIYGECNKRFLSFGKIEVGPEIDRKLRDHFEEFAIYGGYPRVVLSRSVEEKKEVLRNIYNTFFLREVKDVLGLIEDFKLNRLIEALALQAGNLIEYGELGRLSELAYPTLKRYLGFLEKTFVAGFLKPYSKNKRKEIVKNPKIYFFDSGLRNAIVNDFRTFSERTDAGQVLENAVFSQLVKENYKLNFWRDKNGNEVDFVLSLEGGKALAMEVKMSIGSNPGSSIGAFGKRYSGAKTGFVFLKKPKSERAGYYSLPVYVL